MTSVNCMHCGSSMDAACNFCPSCGGPAEPGALPARSAAKKSGARQPVGEGRAGDLTVNVAGLLCYLLLFVSGILFLITEPYNRERFIRFHAFQSILFFIVCVIALVIASVITLVISAVVPSPVAFFLQISFQAVVLLGFCFVWIFLMYKAYCNEMVALPVIGALALRQA